MAALLADVGLGDEVIVPSYTFVSSAAAFTLRGARLVYVDIDPLTLNVDPSLVEAAVSSKTKAIVAVHYAGVSCDMSSLLEISGECRAMLVEDAAHSLMARQDGQSLGSMGHVGTLSFHETKNITCGEGGALLINDESLITKARVMRDKGTNRHDFTLGKTDKYTWVGQGSSFLMSELSAAFLWAQLEQAEEITERRRAIWNEYHTHFQDLEQKGCLRRPLIPEGAEHNAHMYFIVLPDERQRDSLITELMNSGIYSVFHYVPLHTSPYGKTVGRSVGQLTVSETVSRCIVRLPLWLGMEHQQDRIVDAVRNFFSDR